MIFVKGVMNPLPGAEEMNLENKGDQELAQGSAKEKSNTVMLNEEKVMANLLVNGEESTHTDVWY